MTDFLIEQIQSDIDILEKLGLLPPEIIGGKDWSALGSQLLDVERQAFPEPLPILDECLMQRLVAEKDSTTIVIRDKTEKVIGFTNAYSTLEQTAHISCTAITPDYQHQGLVGVLSSALEAELKQKGFLYFTQEVAVENGYAGKVERFYGDRIVEKGEIVDSIVGTQIFFKIRL